MRRLSPSQRIRAGFALVAVAVLAGVIPLVLWTEAGPASDAGRAAAVALLAIQVSSLVWMRDHAERAMAVALVAGIGLQALAPALGVLGLANLSLCAFAAQRPPHRSLWALAAIVAFAPWSAISGGALAGLIAVGGPVLSWSWGELLRTRRARRWGEARRAVAEERARIARELHDVVAHNVSLMVVQAVAADDVFDTRPDQSREALRAIEASGRAALAELRRLLDTVRPDAGRDANDPQPGLEQLDTLVASVRAAGLDVAVRYESPPGPPVDVPAGVDLSAYRIVQEALTNTLRHARATRAAVTVRYTSAAVEVEVTDDGSGPGHATESGRGLVGMRERVALLGGTLEVGAAARGGFRVSAALPLGAPA
jgi:signal transduction histidine kinase